MSANLENSAVAIGLFQSQRRAMPKYVQSTLQFLLFPMLARLCSKSSKLGFNGTWTKNFQTHKLDLEKAKGMEIKLATFVESLKKQGNYRKASTSASLTILKSLTVWIITNCGKFLKRWEFQTTLCVFWETHMWVKKQPLEPHMEQRNGLKLGKEYNEAIYYHPAYLAYMQSTSYEMLD